METRYKASRFNLISAQPDQRKYLFNTLHGSLLKFPGAVERFYADFTESAPSAPPAGELRPLFDLLCDGGFIVPQETDEVDVVRRRLAENLDSTVLPLTILPTLSCNLGCYYCFQRHSTAFMSSTVSQRIVDKTAEMLAGGRFRTLKIDWFGGEPLLAKVTMRYMSERFMALAEAHGLEYKAFIATNGTLLNDDTLTLFRDIGMRRIQITLDGPPEVHDHHRMYKDGQPSFARILDGLKRVAGEFDVFIRINVHRDSIGQSYKLLEILENEGIMQAGRVYIYNALIGPVSIHCEQEIDPKMSFPEFLHGALRFQREVMRRYPSPQQASFFFPKPLQRACGAQGKHALCIDPGGLVFKCGLQAHHAPDSAGFIWEEYESHENCRKWSRIDPLTRPKCAECVFLPLCMGGCVKHIFEQNDFYRDNACTYWSQFIPEIVADMVVNQSLLHPAGKS